MSADLETRLATTAETWERRSPTISTAEVIARASRPALASTPADMGTEIDLATTSRGGHRPRRAGTVAIFGVVAAALIAGIIVITSRPADAPRQQTPPAIAVPPSSIAPSIVTVQSATTELPSPTNASAVATLPADPTTSVPPVSTDAVDAPQILIPAGTASADSIADVRSAALAALATLSSFRATVAVRSTQTDATGSTVGDVTSTNTVTVLADGSLWGSGDLFTWTSYDPRTGVTLDEYVVDDVTHYQQIDGWTDNQTALGILFGTDPTMAAGLTTPGTTVQEITHLGAPAWLLTSHQDPSPDIPGVPTTDDAWVVDKATGLVVRHISNQVQPDGSSNREDSEITALATDVTLPPEFPGSFPDGVDVEHSGDPAAGPIADVATAASRFGWPVFVPSDFDPVRAQLALTYGDTTDANGQPVPHSALTISVPTGFVRVSIRLDSPVVPVFPADPSLQILSSGALAGNAYRFSHDMVSVLGGPVGVTVYDPSGHALDIANSLVLVGG